MDNRIAALKKFGQIIGQQFELVDSIGANAIERHYLNVLLTFEAIGDVTPNGASRSSDDNSHHLTLEK